MGLLNLPRIPKGASPEQIANIFNMAIEEMEHRVNGFLQSSNIQEVGGWRVNQTDLKSKDGDVGLSTEDTGSGDDVRLWAGGTDKDAAPWRVAQNGKMHATGATIESSSGYPKIVIDPSGQLFAAYTDSDTYVAVTPDVLGNGPGIIAVNGVTTGGQYSVSDEYHVKGFQKLILESGTDIEMITGGVDGVVIDGIPLQTSLNAKATAGVSTGSGGGGTYNGGIPIGTSLAIAGGGSVTWAGISVSSHSHTQS